MIEDAGLTVRELLPADGAEVAPAQVPVERLEAQICELAGHLAAATCRFLLLLSDFDARRGWASWDLPSCSAWLSWKCQIAPGTAREQVRVARALRELPVMRAEFAAGRLSYAKIRALTRIATPVTEAGLVDLATPMTAGQLERFTAAYRRASSVDDDESRRLRRLSFRLEDDGSLSLSLRLPSADGAVLLQALRSAVHDVEHPHSQDAHASPAGDQPEPADRYDRHSVESLADAMVDLARCYLGGKIESAGNPDLYQVVVHVGPEALAADPHSDPADVSAETLDPDMSAQTRIAGVSAETRDPGSPRPIGHPADPRRCHLEDGPAISPATARRLACQATVSWMLHDHDGTLLDVGRRHRRPPPALRRAVRERDQYRCRFPGCQSRRTDIHHIRHWADGGATALDNLILLCEAHHVIVHARSYLITSVPARTGPISAPGPAVQPRPVAESFSFCLPDGTLIPAAPQLPGGDGELGGWHDAEITSDTIQPPFSGERMNLGLTLWACFANARVAESRATAWSAGPGLAAA